jgi:predicted MFS family arabinose efflux permease
MVVSVVSDESVGAMSDSASIGTRAFRLYALSMMTAVYTLNLTDRGLMMLLLQPIKVDLHLSDTQLGFLTGAPFAFFYATLGLVIARWADRGNRVTITSLAIGLWALTVMACLLVTNYFQMLAARMAAAVGESGCMPPTYSLLGDYFKDPIEKTRAMSLYWLGSAFSALLSFTVGGWLNELYGWRTAFFSMAFPGVLLAVVFRLTIIEPRVCAHKEGTDRRQPSSVLEVLSFLWRQKTCRHISIALILLYMLSFGLGPWYAAFMIRSHGMGTAELGLWLGLIFGSTGIVGVLIGGYAASTWLAGHERWHMRLTAVVVGSIVPLFAGFLFLRAKGAALLALSLMTLALNMFFAPTYALFQRLVPDNMRATSLAAVMLLANLVGMGLGPQLVGLLSDLLTRSLGADSLRYALLVMSLVALVSAYHFWQAGVNVAGDLRVVHSPRGSAA